VLKQSGKSMDCERGVSMATDGTRRRLSICLINPKFELSFWSYDFVLPMMPGDRRCWAVTAALPALAALAPPDCTVELLDENVEPIDFEALRRFDVIGVTGMMVQGDRMREILTELRKLPATVAVGGPYVSVAEEMFVGLCDVRFVGEAEQTWPAFLDALAAGECVAERYEQAEKTDMTRVPPPRYDLLKAERYFMAALQFSRGCPFLCEFCDIITIFGRRPRLKSPVQMIAEFETIRRAGLRHCFLVDDNFIGNKRAAKVLLRATIDWQRANGYPMWFSTEASIDLADDPELIELLVEANFRQVFIGIESPRVASLTEVRKIQNVRGDTLDAKLKRIRDGGLVISGQFMVGFDHDDEAIFDEQFDFIQRNGIAQALVAILAPVPTTPLHDRLVAEGRLDFADPEVIFAPKLMSRDVLKRGYGRLMERLFEPDAYFTRLLRGYRDSPAFRRRRAALDAVTSRRRTVAARLTALLGVSIQAARLARALAAGGSLVRLGVPYLRFFVAQKLSLGREAIPFAAFLFLCVVHWHYFNVARRPRKGAFGTVIPVRRPLKGAA
jgi:radical SAM superfamily enzyme YgiQ (UPF0313 family)